MISVSMTLWVAADTTVGTYVLPRLLGDFHRHHPNVELKLTVANRAAVRGCLLSGQADLVIAGRPPEVDGLMTEPFLANPLVVVSSPEHVLVGQSHVTLSRLSEEIFLLREEGSGTRAAMEELFEVTGMPLKVGMVLGDVEAITNGAVAANLGVSVNSALAVRREVQYGNLAILDAGAVSDPATLVYRASCRAPFGCQHQCVYQVLTRRRGNRTSEDLTASNVESLKFRLGS